jgi:hypothetical protein
MRASASSAVGSVGVVNIKLSFVFYMGIIMLVHIEWTTIRGVASCTRAHQDVSAGFSCIVSVPSSQNSMSSSPSFPTIAPCRIPSWPLLTKSVRGVPSVVFFAKMSSSVDF